MEDMKLLYQLEYEVKEIREQYIKKLKYDNLRLRDLLDLGFNNVYIHDSENKHIYNLFKDSEGFYTIDNWNLEDDAILDAIVEYDYSELYEDYGYGDFVEVGVKFKDAEALKKLDYYMEVIKDEK